MTLEQKQETLKTAIAEMQHFIKNANHNNDETGTQLIVDSIVIVSDDYTESQEARDYHDEQQELVFDVINNVGFEDEDNITLEELDEILNALENAVQDVEVPNSPKQQKEAIEIAIAELNEYIDNGDYEHTSEIQQYWINDDETYDDDLFRGHYFDITNSELTEGQQVYIWKLFFGEPAFENETIDHEYIDGLVDVLQEALEELEPVE